MSLPFFSHDITLGLLASPLPWPRFRLKPKDQMHHATIWGRTGSGKSKLLESIFLQHLKKGHGVGLIEPHHDLSFDCLTRLISQGFFRHEAAYDRLVYVDWGNGCYVPFNVLAGRADPHTKALNALEAMLRVWPELSEAPMFQQLFLSSLIVLIANELPITHLYRLLTDAPFRDASLQKVSDPVVLQAFESYDKLGRDQVQAAGSTLRRAFLLSFSPLARYTLGQSENWLDFRTWMDEGRSFIINLGNINDHETRKLIGAMLMVQIEQAALSRTDMPAAARTPCTLLVDEWPACAPRDHTIGTILSQTRKFNLRLYLAAQSLSQVSSQRLAGALENCRLAVVFGLGRDSAELQAKHIGQADPFAIKEEALTATQHNQYLTIPEQFESWCQELQNLSPRTAYVKLHDKPAARIRTLRLPNVRVAQEELEEVLATFRSRYQRTPKEAERATAGLSPPGAAQVPDPGAYAPSTTPFYTQFFRASTRENGAV